MRLPNFQSLGKISSIHIQLQIVHSRFLPLCSGGIWSGPAAFLFKCLIALSISSLLGGLQLISRSTSAAKDFRGDAGDKSI